MDTGTGTGRDAEGLILWFRKIYYREKNDDGTIARERVSYWHVQRDHDDETHQRIAACGYRAHEDRADASLFADIESHDGPVCEKCGLAVAKQDAADMTDE